VLGVNLLSCVSIGFYLAGFLSAGGETMCEVLFVILKGIIEVRALSRDCRQISNLLHTLRCCFQHGELERHSCHGLCGLCSLSSAPLVASDPHTWYHSCSLV
jgi:hypothetical protein